MTLSLLFSSFHCSSYYAKMSTGISVKEPKNLESKSKWGKLEKEQQVEWTS